MEKGRTVVERQIKLTLELSEIVEILGISNGNILVNTAYHDLLFQLFSMSKILLMFHIFIFDGLQYITCIRHSHATDGRLHSIWHTVTTH